MLIVFSFAAGTLLGLVLGMILICLIQVKREWKKDASE